MPLFTVIVHFCSLPLFTIPIFYFDWFTFFYLNASLAYHTRLKPFSCVDHTTLKPFSCIDHTRLKPFSCIDYTGSSLNHSFDLFSPSDSPKSCVLIVVQIYLYLKCGSNFLVIFPVFKISTLYFTCLCEIVWVFSKTVHMTLSKQPGVVNEPL